MVRVLDGDLGSDAHTALKVMAWPWAAQSVGHCLGVDHEVFLPLDSFVQ